MYSNHTYVRINLSSRCDCINGDFFGHVFKCDLGLGDKYEKIADVSYTNLTIGDLNQMFNIYDRDRLPDDAIINMPVNCSCGNRSVSNDYRLLLTYPLRAGETLDSVSSVANLKYGLIRSYKLDVDFSPGSGLVYITWRLEFRHSTVLINLENSGTRTSRKCEPLNIVFLKKIKGLKYT
ncbi:putative non-specific serine/threonine protein kinase [Helianthus anomalus]